MRSPLSLRRSNHPSPPPSPKRVVLRYVPPPSPKKSPLKSPKKHKSPPKRRTRHKKDIHLDPSAANRPPREVELGIRGSLGLLFGVGMSSSSSPETDLARALETLPDPSLRADPTVLSAAHSQLQAFKREHSARIIQSAYRSWSSRQMVLGWVEFSQMRLDIDNSDPSTDPAYNLSTNEKRKSEFIPPPNAFQERLAARAERRMRRRELRLVFRSWAGLVASFVKCRERILVCSKARRISGLVNSWRRVIERQLALKKVVYIQERLVRFRHFRLWRGLTIIRRNMFWAQRRALYAIKHYLAGTATLNRDRWENIVYLARRLWARRYIWHWYEGAATRKWYLRYIKAAARVKDEILRRLGKEALEMRQAKEIERLSRERATMKKISRRAVAALQEYIATEEGSDEFGIYWRIVRKHRRSVKKAELRKLRLLMKKPKTVSGEINQIMSIQYNDTKELYKDYFRTDWKVPSYKCLEERITYEARRVSRENFRREQPPLFDCPHCKKPFVFHYLLRRHKLIYAGECEPSVPKHLEWIKAEKFSKAAMQRIVDVFYSHLVADRLRGKRGAAAALEASSGGVGAEGGVLEGVDKMERSKMTKGWGKIKMAVGDENLLSSTGEGANAFAGGVSALKMKLMAAKAKAREIMEEEGEAEEEEEEEEEQEEPPEWVRAAEHPTMKKFFAMIKVVGEASVKKRMTALNFDPAILDDPDCMVGLEHSIYRDKMVPQKILEEGHKYFSSEDEEQEQEDEDEGMGFGGGSAEGSDAGEEDEEEKERKREERHRKAKEKLGLAGLLMARAEEER